MHQVKYRLELDRVKVIFGEYKSVMYLNDREHSTIHMPGQNIMFDKKMTIYFSLVSLHVTRSMDKYIKHSVTHHRELIIAFST